MKYSILVLLALMSSWFALEAKSELNVQISRSEDGTQLYTDILMTNQSRISALTLDMIYPAGLTYVETTTGSLTQKRDSLGNKLEDTWNVFSKDFSLYNFIRIASFAKHNRDIRDGLFGSVLRVTFNVEPGKNYSAKDFYFNNASAVDGMDRVEVKMPIGVLGRNGFLTFCSTQDMIIEGANVYYGVLRDNTLHMTQVTPGVPIRSREGVLLKGKEGTPIYGTTVDFANIPARNDLEACYNGKSVDAGTMFTLSVKNGLTAFYLNQDTTIHYGKAFIKADPSVQRISIDFNAFRTASFDIFNIYNIDGPRVQEIRNGLNSTPQ